MVYDIQIYGGFGLCPSSGIKHQTLTFRKLDLFPYSRERRKTPALLGPLERANLQFSAVIQVKSF
jgi:hypothetical protein